MNRRSCRVVFCLVLLALAARSSLATDKVTVFQSGGWPGHYLTWKGKLSLPIGDSVIQDWMESDESSDQRICVDAPAERSIDLLRLWASKGTRAELH